MILYLVSKPELLGITTNRSFNRKQNPPVAQVPEIVFSTLLLNETQVPSHNGVLFFVELKGYTELFCFHNLPFNLYGIWTNLKRTPSTNTLLILIQGSKTLRHFVLAGRLFQSRLGTLNFCYSH